SSGKYGMSKQIKKLKVGKVHLTGIDPMQFDIESEVDAKDFSKNERNIADRVGKTLNAYLRTCKQLLEGRYHHLRDLAPVHLADTGKVLAMCCLDGVVLRYERNAGVRELAVAWSKSTLIDVAEQMSQNFVHCYLDKDYTSTVPETGLEITLFKGDSAT